VSSKIFVLEKTEVSERFNPLNPSGSYVPPTSTIINTLLYIYGFRVILSVNRDYFHKQRQQIDLFCGEVWCFICGTNWILKYYLDELRPCSTSLLAALLILPFPLPNAKRLTFIKTAFTSRTSGHCLGTFVAANLNLCSPHSKVVPIATPPPPPLSLRALSLSTQRVNEPLGANISSSWRAFKLTTEIYRLKRNSVTYAGHPALSG
jgi:hypothetical protein